MLTSSVEYGLQDLCKVWPCLDWGCSPSGPMLRSTPRWSLRDWWLEVVLRTAAWCITQVHHRLSPCFLIPEGLSSGIPLEGVQHHPRAPQGLGNPREGRRVSCRQWAAGKPRCHHPCPLVTWQDDALGKAPVLGSTQHPSCVLPRGCVLGRQQRAKRRREDWRRRGQGAGAAQRSGG